MRVRTRPHCLESAHSIIERKILRKNDIPLIHVYAYVVTKATSLILSQGHAFGCIQEDIRDIDKVTVPRRPTYW